MRRTSSLHRCVGALFLLKPNANFCQKFQTVDTSQMYTEFDTISAQRNASILSANAGQVKKSASQTSSSSEHRLNARWSVAGTAILSLLLGAFL